MSGGIRAGESRSVACSLSRVVPAPTAALGLPVGPGRLAFGREGDAWWGEGVQGGCLPGPLLGNRTQARGTRLLLLQRETLLCSECPVLWLRAGFGFL